MREILCFVVGVVGIYFVQAGYEGYSFGTQHALTTKNELVSQGIPEELFNDIVFPYMYEKKWGLINVFKSYAGAVGSICFSSNGTYLALGADNGVVCVWDLDSDTECMRSSGHSSWVTNVSFAQDNRVIVSEFHDGAVHGWSLSGCRKLFNLDRHNRVILRSAVISTETMRVRNMDNKSVMIWDTALQERLAQGTGCQEMVWSASVSPDKKKAALGYLDGVVRLWDFDAQEEVAYLTGHKGMIVSVCFSADGALVASGAEDNSIRLWRSDTWMKFDSKDQVEGAIGSVQKRLDLLQGENKGIKVRCATALSRVFSKKKRNEYAQIQLQKKKEMRILKQHCAQLQWQKSTMQQ